MFGGHNRDSYLSETTLLLLGECAIYATDLSAQALCCDTPHFPTFYHGKKEVVM